MSDLLFQKLISGQLDPYTLACQLVEQGSVSEITARQLDNDIASFLSTGMLMIDIWEPIMLTLDAQSQRITFARSLAKLNYHIATLVSTDDDLIADVSFKLFQLLDCTSSTLVERRNLLREFYPSLVDRIKSASSQFRIHFVALRLYFELSGSNKKYFTDILQYGQLALNLAEVPGIRDSEELCWVYFWIGVASNEVGPDGAESLKLSITYLKHCTQMEQHCQGAFRGSALNSLGYSLYLLGRLEEDAQIVTEAIATLRKAYLYRVNATERQVTQGNLACAQNLLASLNSQSSYQPSSVTQAASEASGTITSNSNQEISSAAIEDAVRPLRAAGRILKDAADEIFDVTKRTPHIRAYMEHLFEAVPQTNVSEQPYLQARFELALGIGLVFNGDAAAAICFLKAAARKWENLDTDANLPWKTATYYNMGLAFSELKGTRDPNQYVGQAIMYFERAMELFSILGAKDRSQVCASFIECLKDRVANTSGP